jgi:hypothetical protein
MLRHWLGAIVISLAMWALIAAVVFEAGHVGLP